MSSIAAFLTISKASLRTFNPPAPACLNLSIFFITSITATPTARIITPIPDAINVSLVNLIALLTTPNDFANPKTPAFIFPNCVGPSPVNARVSIRRFFCASFAATKAAVYFAVAAAGAPVIAPVTADLAAEAPAPILSRDSTIRPLTPPLAIVNAFSSDISLPLLFNIPPPNEPAGDVLVIPESSKACCLKLIAEPTSSADIERKPTVLFLRSPDCSRRLNLDPVVPPLLRPPCSIENSSSANAFLAALDTLAVGSSASTIPPGVLLSLLNGSIGVLLIAPTPGTAPATAAVCSLLYFRRDLVTDI